MDHKCKASGKQQKKQSVMSIERTLVNHTYKDYHCRGASSGQHQVDLKISDLVDL